MLGGHCGSGWGIKALGWGIIVMVVGEGDCKNERGIIVMVVGGGGLQ